MKITCIVSAQFIENYVYYFLKECKRNFPDNELVVYIDSSNAEHYDTGVKNNDFFSKIDRRFKAYKQSAFERKSKIDLERLQIDSKELQADSDFGTYCFIVNKTPQEIDQLPIPTTTKIISWGYQNIVNNADLVNAKKIQIPIVIKIRDFKGNWTSVSNLILNKDIGILNTLEKYYWYKILSLIKFIKNPELFNEIAIPEKKFSKRNYYYYYLTLCLTIFQRKFHRKSNSYRWNILLENEEKQKKELQKPKKAFWADPFIEIKDDFIYLFIEEMNYQTNLGEIACIVVDKNYEILEKRTLLANETHFSYPQVFQDNQHYYMMPENSASEKLTIYKAVDFPFQWEKHIDIMSNIKLIDATVACINGMYWIFANKLHDYDYDNNDGLFLYYNESLLDNNWKEHPLNPIITDSSKARSAGSIYQVDGKWYRPSQDCYRQYGANVKINQIINLSPTEYLEETLETIYPPNKAIGLHTINKSEKITVYDVFR